MTHSYTPTTWTDEVPGSTPIKYVITDDSLGSIAASATITLATSVTSGTPINAANLNNLESGVVNAQADANQALTDAAAAQAAANAAIAKSLLTTVGDIIVRGSSVPERVGKPGSTGLLQMSSAGAASYRAVKATVELQIVGDSSDVDTAAVGYFFVPSTMDGMNLVRAEAFVLTAGTTNPTTVQVRNLTKYASNDALSTAISIASGGTVGTVGSVNTSYDDVSTNDKIKVYVTGNSTTKPLGLIVVLEYQLP